MKSRTVVLPHGVGFNKYLPDVRGSGTRLAGLPLAKALRSGRVMVVLSHPEEEHQLRGDCRQGASALLTAGSEPSRSSVARADAWFSTKFSIGPA